MNTMDDEMLNYDYNDPYSYSSTPGYVDYDSDLVEKPLPSTSTGPIFSPPYQSPYHLRESGPASPFSSQGYSYDSCPLSSCLSPRREPFLPAFSHGLHALHHLLLLPASLLRLPRLLRATARPTPSWTRLLPSTVRSPRRPSTRPSSPRRPTTPSPTPRRRRARPLPGSFTARGRRSRGRSRARAGGEAEVRAEGACWTWRCSRRGVALARGSWSSKGATAVAAI